MDSPDESSVLAYVSSYYQALSNTENVRYDLVDYCYISGLSSLMITFISADFSLRLPLENGLE